MNNLPTSEPITHAETRTTTTEGVETMTTPTTTTFNVFARILCDVYDDKTIIAIYREYCQMRDNMQWHTEHGNPQEIPTPEQYAEYEREKAEQTPAGWFIYWED